MYIIDMFKYKAWHKISANYDYFVMSYPTLLCVTGDNLLSISEAEAASETHTLIVTRPINEETISYFLIHRIIQKCRLNIFQVPMPDFMCSDQTMQLLQGSDRKTGTITNIMCTRSHLPVKYVILVFAAQLDSSSVVNDVVIQFYQKMNNKIR